MEKPTSWVYFIQEGADGPIKIGYTGGNPRGRMAALQTGNAKPLNLLAWSPGTQDDEKALHERFTPLRMVGEWFRPEEPLLGFVRGVAWTCRDVELPATGPAFSDEDVAFMCGIADGRIAMRSSIAIENLMGNDASKFERKRMHPLLFDLCRYAESAMNFVETGDGSLRDGIAAAVYEATPRKAVLRALIAEHARSVMDGRFSLNMARGRAIQIAAFAEVHAIVRRAEIIGAEFAGRERLDDDDLARVAAARRDLDSARSQDTDAVRVYGVDTIAAADAALAEIESVHGHAVTYLRALDAAADGEHPYDNEDLPTWDLPEDAGNLSAPCAKDIN